MPYNLGCFTSYIDRELLLHITCLWIQFLQALAVGMILLFVPGFLVLRALRIPRMWAIGAAPLISGACIFCLSEIFACLHINPMPFALTAVLTAFGAVCIFLIMRTQSCTRDITQGAMQSSMRGAAQTTRAEQQTIFSSLPQIPARTLLYYLVAGTISAICFFLFPLKNPENLAHGWDIVAHLNFTQTMIHNGAYTSLNPSYYSAAEAFLNPSSVPYGFYPSGWNILCAYIAQFGGTTLPIAANALNYIACALVYPLSMMLFVRSAFAQEDRALRLTSLLCGISCIFPWTLLVYGPLYPFIIACCAMPSVFWIFMHLTRSKTPLSELWRLGMCFILAGICLVLLHTSSFFACVIIMTPWCMARISRTHRKLAIIQKGVRPVFLSIAFFAVVLLAWAGCYYVLVLGKHALNFWWKSYTTVPQALAQLLLLEFVGTGLQSSWFVVPQPVLTLLFIMGAWKAIKLQRGRFLIVSFAYLAFLCILMISYDGALKGLLGSFWYTDPYRLAALAIICAMPLLGLGLDNLIDVVENFVAKRLKNRAGKKINDIAKKGNGKKSANAQKAFLVKATSFVVCILVLAAHTLIVLPGGSKWPKGETFPPLSAPFTNIKVIFMGTHDNRFLNSAKLDFLKRAKQITKNDVVLNNPYDGSVLAYGLCDMNVFWRYPHTLETAEGSYERPGFARIRSEAHNLATNYKVQDSCEWIQAHYLIQLRGNIRKDASLAETYMPYDFAGIDRVKKDTPAYELVLEEGDMRLYRIKIPKINNDDDKTNGDATKN